MTTQHTAPQPSSPTASTYAHETATLLVQRLSTPQKISLLHQAAPAIEDPKLAAFTTGTEALHGLSWLGTATVFPQPIGLAATWDLDLIERIGDAVATEVRAKHTSNPSVSLNVWAPVVNPLRHPLWGRNEEGYSEDPHLTADCAIAYTRGLRGDHPSIWKTVPTLKHFLAYNNEIDRAVTSSDMRARVLQEYEYPAFRRPLEAGCVGAVMPSYNLVNDRPNHVARSLLNTLRSWSPHPIAVVSDAAAPGNLVDGERYFPDHIASHAALLHAGVDSFTDNDRNATPTIERITAALHQGLITEEEINTAVYRMLYLRALTGEFSNDNPYNTITAEHIDLPEHRTLAREAAAKGVVLLKNNGALPLRHEKVAVIGPFANHVVTDWYSGTPPYTVSITEGLAAQHGANNVTHTTGSDHIALWSPTAHGYLTTTPDGLVSANAAEAHAQESWELTDWGDGISSLRSTNTGKYLSGADWILSATSPRIGGWVAHEAFTLHHHSDGTVSLNHRGSGKWIRVQHGAHLLVADTTDPQQAERFDLRTLRNADEQLQQLCSEADHIILTVGNDPHLSGRETEDRPHLNLPLPAQRMWRIAKESGRPVTLAIISSYPYALGEIANQADAIVWSSHAGQELGNGLADVLTGASEPYGRLAQEWVTDDTCPPHILNYDIIASGGTYWYNTCEPAFAFGTGLNYGTVTYTELALHTTATPEHPSNPTVPTHATVTITNTSDRTVAELVQIYVGHTWAPHVRSQAPARRLAGYHRVYLAPGETASVNVELNHEAFTTYDPRTGTHIAGGDYRIWVGTARTEHISTEHVIDVDASPTPVAGQTLLAADFDTPHQVRLSDVNQLEGDCVAVARGHHVGYIDFHDIDLTDVDGVTATLATDTAGPAGGLTVEVLAQDTQHPVARGTITEPWVTPDASRYAWHTAALPLTWSNDAPRIGTLRMTLTGNIRLHTLSFTAG
ncbi:glycoside hydrolase family 3 C-terminal domain-containing protein [Jonesia quinghaiensis]|uniref:glycoside hydrolase family 3 C-terminal domain-containing protein n=1 Tax=Jonesia quinghaiensis TaxID=262806 RepID=UPI0004008DBB|nr:glycoside hydrolase family 3 C-terminal domain-containing protein [Jonesia quinghaiensis]